jgi:hypothetical protein
MAAVDFNVERHRDFIRRRGEPIEFWKALPCSCRNPISGEWDRSHPVCDGTGYLYTQQPVSAYRGLVRNVSLDQVLASFGSLRVGDITCTTMPDEIPIAVGDLVAVPSRTFRVTDTRVRARGNPQIDSMLDPLRHERVSSIARVWDATHGDYTQNGEGVENPEYELSGHAVKWLPPGGAVHNPSRDAVYSVEYYAYATYIAIPERLMSRRSVGGTAMPQRVVLRLRNPEELKA